MTTGQYDADIKLVYIAEPASTTSADAVDLTNTGFDIRADIEVGAAMRAFGGTFEVHVAVRNLSQSSTIFNHTTTPPGTVPSSPPGTFEFTEVVNVPAGTAGAAALDALDVVAVLRFAAGANTDHSVSYADPVIVIA
jgi:hypothetical protein